MPEMSTAERELRALLAIVHAAYLPLGPVTRDIRRRIERALAAPQPDPIEGLQ